MVGNINRIFLACILATGHSAQISALSDQEIEAIADQYERQASTYIEKYTDPAFLKTVEQPELVRQEQQRSLNSTLLFSFNNPLSTIHKSFGIYVYDLLLCSHACGSWFLEWVLYKQLSAICKTREKNQTKRLTIIVGYVVISLLLRQMGQSLLLNEPPTPTILNSQTPSLCGTMAHQFPTIMNSVANPQTWTTIINSYFKLWGFLPSWTNYWSYEITKQITVMIIFAWWYERSYEKQQTFVEWIKTKTAAMTTIHCLVDVGVALPVYIKIARWIFTVSKQGLRILTDSEPEPIPEKS